MISKWYQERAADNKAFPGIAPPVGVPADRSFGVARGGLAPEQVGSRPMHVVAADEPEKDTTIIATVYEADPARWDTSFRKRTER
jgi:hypothetical protein